MSDHPVPFAVRDLGRSSYREAWAEQLRLHAAVADGAAPPTLLLTEHEPVVTFGRKGGREHLVASESELTRRGFELVDIERGGDVTYHGPGQLVGYGIFPIGRRVRDYLRRLEDAVADLCAGYGVRAVGSPGYAGVWVGDRKVCAIGVAVKRGVAFHGFALNVATDLSHFDLIVPCGIRDRGVTRLADLVRPAPSMADVKERLTGTLAYRLHDLPWQAPSGPFPKRGDDAAAAAERIPA